jgi:hypothetical protein
VDVTQQQGGRQAGRVCDANRLTAKAGLLLLGLLRVSIKGGVCVCVCSLYGSRRHCRSSSNSSGFSLGHPSSAALLLLLL